MPRSFDVSADYHGSVEQIYQAFTEADYWLGRLEFSSVDESKLESMRVGGESGQDGTIDVVTLQVMHRRNLPSVVTQVHRGDLCVRREETWSALADGTTTASIRGSVLDSPVSVAGTAVLSSTAAGGSKLDVQMTVQVRIPLIGGKLEKLIGAQLTTLISEEQRFTTMWLDSRA
ncbi:DUF2505 domain-containing protein [Mycobacterium conspicuum]|jgi:hypothetical protein|uniref:Uncharacterized protein n=1 Tax=Mycobacterium conspicuum TaxID=44010 RepID=A0A1X1SWW2_9MYCO|nr:DUF2505 domain-containing protein [Mycobacterium conspicuum]ORV35380.1 hypothetical protein AWC00_25475 [Mycobacterium conspicuum]BBZ37306.1 hypothetical protein MCNS_03690 [Mycobacterium conspicuum]